MYEVKSPNNVMQRLDGAEDRELIKEFRNDCFSEIIFLAGGITNCPDWQQDVINSMKNERCVLINPRRAHWDVNDDTMERKQIEWEHYHLDNSMSILFWFPKETVCPITLFELGKFLNSGKRLYIGCHPEYSRINDVRIQVSLEIPRQKIYTSLNDLINDVRFDLHTQVQ